MTRRKTALELLRELPGELPDLAAWMLSVFHTHQAQDKAARQIVAAYERDGEEAVRKVLTRLAEEEISRRTNAKSLMHKRDREHRERDRHHSKRKSALR